MMGTDAAWVARALAGLIVLLLPWRADADVLAYWRFDEQPPGTKLDAEAGTDKPPVGFAEDHSGRGNRLRTYNTRPTFYPPDTSATFLTVDGLPVPPGATSNERCARFTGGQDFYTDPEHADASLESAALRSFTVEGFVRLSALSNRLKEGFQVVVGKDGRPVDRLPNQPFVAVIAGKDDRYAPRDCLSIHLIDRGGHYRSAVSREPFKADQWYAFAAVCDGTSLKLHINRFDGKGYRLEGETSVEGGLIESKGAWTIGRGMYARRPNSWLHGDVDEIRISDEALQPSEWLASGIYSLPQPPAPATRPALEPQLCFRGLADPTAILHEGTYYVYGTSHTRGFDVWSSKDLKNWTKGPTVLARGDGVWGDSAFWAPEAIKHKGKFYLFYSASGIMPFSGGRRSVRANVAVADSPTGPFKEVVSRMPLVGRAVIDPQPFIDEDGKAYLYFVTDISENNGSGQIYVVQLSDDLLSPLGEAVPCLAPSQAWEGTTWNEGPFVFRDGDSYIMMYSAEFWGSPNYAVGIATAPSPWGPWDKRDDNPFLHRYAGLRGTGHNCLVRSPDGKRWLTFFHAHRDEKLTARDTYIAEVLIDRDERGQARLTAKPWSPGATE